MSETSPESPPTITPSLVGRAEGRGNVYRTDRQRRDAPKRNHRGHGKTHRTLHTLVIVLRNLTPRYDMASTMSGVDLASLMDDDFFSFWMDFLVDSVPLSSFTTVEPRYCDGQNNKTHFVRVQFRQQTAATAVFPALHQALGYASSGSTGREVEGSGCGLIKVWMERLRQTMKTISQDRCPGRGSNRTPPHYKFRSLLHRAVSSVRRMGECRHSSRHS